MLSTFILEVQLERSGVKFSVLLKMFLAGRPLAKLVLIFEGLQDSFIFHGQTVIVPDKILVLTDSFLISLMIDYLVAADS